MGKKDKKYGPSVHPPSAFKLRGGTGNVNPYSGMQQKGLITPLMMHHNDKPARTEKQIDRYAKWQKVKEALTPNIKEGFTNLGGKLSKLTTRMKPGGARNVVLGVSNALMGHKSNDSDQQLVSRRKARIEIASNQTDYSGYGVLKSQGWGGGQSGVCPKGRCTKP